MKNKWYKADIMERFMTEKERRSFDEKYTQYKVVNMGIKARDNLSIFDKLIGKVVRHSG